MCNADDLWKKVYFRQAKSDYSIYRYLNKKDLPGCHRLHYLQMSLEKLAKSYCYRKRNIPPDIQASHNYIAKFIPHVYREFLLRLYPKKRFNNRKFRSIRLLCREIDYSSPANDDDGRRIDNCEYPWSIQGTDGKILDIRVPCEYDFPVLEQLTQHSLFFKIIELIFETGF